MDKLQVALDYAVKSTPIDKINANLKETVKITDKVESASKKADTGIKGMVKQLGALAIAGVSVGKALDLSKESIKMSSDFTENTNKMKVVFGSLYDETNKWAENYSKTMGMSSVKTREA